MIKFGKKKNHTVKESTKELIDGTIEHICKCVQKYEPEDLLDPYFDDSVRALAELISARAQIKD